MGLAKRRQIIGAGMVVVVGLAVLAVPVLGSLLVAIALWAAAVLAMRSRASRHDGNALARLITWLAMAKVVATLAAYCAFRFLYGGGDASFYDASGRRIAQAWASGQHAKTEYPFPGTATIEYLTGGLYLVVKPLAVSGYLLFSVAGFAGAYLWYRAIRIGAPDLEPRRLALLTLGLPTVLFWTSPISKDAVLMLALGAAAVGGSQLLTGRVRGALLLFVGLGFALTVRPHLAAMFAGSLGLAALFGRGNRRGRRRVLTKLVAGVLTIGAALFAISWFGSYSTLTGGESASEIQQAVQSFGQASGTGGSAFVAKPATSLTDIPQAVLNVVFRPSLLDVRNPLMLIAALESTYLLLFGFVGPVLQGRLDWHRTRHPLFVLGASFVCLFAFAFSNFANYGYLARQRAQIMPILAAMTLLLRRPTVPNLDEPRADSHSGVPVPDRAPVGYAVAHRDVS